MCSKAAARTQSLGFYYRHSQVCFQIAFQIMCCNRKLGTIFRNFVRLQIVVAHLVKHPLILAQPLATQLNSRYVPTFIYLNVKF